MLNTGMVSSASASVSVKMVPRARRSMARASAATDGQGSTASSPALGNSTGPIARRCAGVEMAGSALGN